MQLNDHVIGVGSERTARLLSHFADGIEQAIHGGWNQNPLEDPWHVHVDHCTRHANLCYPRPSIGQTAHVDMFAVLCVITGLCVLYGVKMSVVLVVRTA